MAELLLLANSLEFTEQSTNKQSKIQVYDTIGRCYYSTGRYKDAIQHFQVCLAIAKQIGDKNGKITAFCNLGASYNALSQYDKAIECQKMSLIIAKEIGDRNGEGTAYGNLGVSYNYLGQYDKAIEYQKMSLIIAKEIGDRNGEGRAYGNLGVSYDSLSQYGDAESNLRKSVKCYFKLLEAVPNWNEYKATFIEKFVETYKGLVKVLLYQKKKGEALILAENGRSRALVDLMSSNPIKFKSRIEDLYETRKVVKALGSTVLFFALLSRGICTWVIQPNGDILFHHKTCTEDLENLIRKAVESIPNDLEMNGLLKDLYQILLEPVRQHVVGSQLIIVPDGRLALVPFAALKDENGHYVAESLRVRLIPSLTTAKIIKERSVEVLSGQARPLIVGEPEVGKVWKDGKVITAPRLPFAIKEVEFISKILHVKPLVGDRATKRRFLRRVGSASLIHVVARADKDRGEILLARSPEMPEIPKATDLMLLTSDLERKRIKAKLVVLSFCHSGCGDVMKGEGVVGIARAFLGAGARAVLVTLWAIDDMATTCFMSRFYEYLKNGESANGALNQAMKDVREYKKFHHPRYWAPFVLLGEDVTPFPKP